MNNVWVKGKLESFIEESKNSIAYLSPGRRLNAQDWNKIYDNAIFLFNEWIDETEQQVESDIDVSAEKYLNEINSELASKELPTLTKSEYLKAKNFFKAGWQKKQESNSDNKVTRVEVIDDKGRSYVNWDAKNKVELSYQDEGKTLKIFITNEK